MIRTSCLAALAATTALLANTSVAQSPHLGTPPAVPPTFNRAFNRGPSPAPIAGSPYGLRWSGFVTGAPLAQPKPADGDRPLAVKATKPPAKSEVVAIQTRDKQELAANFYPPKAKGRAPAVLLIHDAGRDRTGFEAVAALLQKRGFAILAIDLRGHGGSKNELYDWTTTPEPDREKLWSLAMRDLDAATKFLRNRADVHNSNLSLVGVGSGGALAVRYARDDVNTRAVILVDPRASSFGFDTYKDVVELAGLPTLLMVPSPGRQGAERLQTEAHKQNDGLQYVDIKSVKPKNGDPLVDKRVASEVTAFLREEAMPKR